jgi:hypothetical protein
MDITTKTLRGDFMELVGNRTGLVILFLLRKLPSPSGEGKGVRIGPIYFQTHGIIQSIVASPAVVKQIFREMAS